MLINCPECNKEISDKAFACPNCGYPIAKAPQRRRASQNRYKKLPNGFGSIKHLSGNRRRPYACFPPTKGWTNEGKAIVPKAIGYYATYNEAYLALAEYNKSPYDTYMKSATFKDIYDMLYEHKFVKNGKRTSKSSRASYSSAFNLCKSLHNEVFADIKVDQFQETLDSIDKSYSTLTAVKNLYSQMFKFAMASDLGITTNLSPLIVINKEVDTEKGEPFTEKDIKILWEDSEYNIVSKITLIMIYSGLRIKEAIEVSEIDLEQRVFIGGVKSSSGKNRIVPIHDGIFPFIDSLIEFRNKKHTTNYFRSLFNQNLQRLGIRYTEDNKVHTPHDCRHTFSWLADKYNMNDFAKHKIMGHSFGNDVEKSVYGHRTMEELKKEMNKIKICN